MKLGEHFAFCSLFGIFGMKEEINCQNFETFAS